uniref:Chemotaxis protein n=1 Tax=Heligmosomoides polygyrus TaxID=6339 RepID=A0A183FC91_HELPZ
LAGRKFTNYDNLKSDIADSKSQPPDFWAKGIGDLPNRWATVVDTVVDYIVD